ncbi:MAG: long-chain fatty acid--CoA ligase [Chloroflexi bacterium]|nr:long-chain fatty acid--CoA ligase [Chloroflexota bacterium]
MNLLDLFQISIDRYPYRTAIQFGDQKVTFAELNVRANQLAHAFSRLGLCKGDRAAFYLPNSLELVTTYLAFLKLGVITVPINLLYRETEITHIAGDCTPRLLVTGKEQLGVIAPLRDRLNSVEHIVLAEDLPQLAAGETSRAPMLPAGGDDLAVILYTSGTTGRSKGAMLSHDNFVANIAGVTRAWAWRADDQFLLTLPLFHAHGLAVGLHGALATGCTTILHDRFHADAVFDSLLADGITLFFGVPTMYLRLLEEAARRFGVGQRVPMPAMRLFVSGSAPLSAETFNDFKAVFGHEILERYGMTETLMNLSNLYAGPRLPGTVGVPLPGVSARICDSQGQPLPDGEAGEVYLRGSNIFQGYWNDAEKTAQAFHTDAQGRQWFRTGDIGRRDPLTGFYRLEGRARELIISAGFNIYPREVEEVLESHPAVREAAVAGIPDRVRGELPKAYVVLAGDRSVTAEALQEYCGERLASFKVPKVIAFVPLLPRNALGKVQKHRLAATGSD